MKIRFKKYFSKYLINNCNYYYDICRYIFK